MTGAGVALAGIGAALDPEPLGEAELPNPLALPDAADDVVQGIIAVTDVLALPLLVAAAASLVVRFRRSRGVERLQLKWFTFDAAIVGVSLGVSAVSGPLADAAFVVGLLALAALPVTAGLAILRYRLYDIDLVIRRTLDLRRVDGDARRARTSCWCCWSGSPWGSRGSPWPSRRSRSRRCSGRR